MEPKKPAHYDHAPIEKKWQEQWQKDGTYRTENTSDRPKQYILDMFPYPSGEGLHVGHPRGYIATDVYSRKKRMEGFNVLHPMGWDAFGLPAENFAIKHKIHPRVAVEKNVARFKEQLSIIGLDYDWSHEINTTDPEFYKWTQWMFLQMFKKGLAYESYEPVNWCPTDKTVLANEDVEPDGTCERCGTKVEKRPMRQWVLKITDYADRLLADLEKLPKWPEGVKEAQRNWIGRSEGSKISFKLKVESGKDEQIEVFTTRADTLFGVTYAVLAPEHELVESLKFKVENTEEVEAYIASAKERTEVDRTNARKEKTGVELKGVKAINPANGEEIPVWIADYVLGGYGTGAVMAVPAHDERDFEFSKKHGLPIKEVLLEIAVPKGNHEITQSNKGGLAVITRKGDNKILLQFENKWNQWRLPGGSLEENETPEEGVVREVLEETGYSVKIISSLGSTYVCYKRFTDNGKMYERHAHGFVVEIDGTTKKDLVLTDDEVAAGLKYEWVEPKEAIELMRRNPVLMGEAEFVERYVSKKEIFTGYGILTGSGQFDGLTSEEAKIKITEFVGGKMVSTYRLKDWVFSRQRYWGEPIPIIHCEACGAVPVPEKDLPVVLPEVESYEPTGTGESPLASIEEWVNVACPNCGKAAKRETNTMPQWAGSSWYYLRFIDPHNTDSFLDTTKEQHWMPVDVYVGGDHATRHLIYARFWHKFLSDIGAVSGEEPFPRLEFLGFILAEDGRKMSKRWGNIINPDEMVARFGADAFRLYEMFIGPFESTTPWNTNGLVGTYRFLEKVWRLTEKIDLEKKVCRTDSLVHKTVKGVTEDIDGFKFNTAVSKMMILVNALEKEEKIVEGSYRTLLRLLAPFAPHLTEELWHELGETASIHLSSWPTYDPAKATDETVTIGVQVNGKARAEITIASGATREEIEAAALALPRVQEYLAGAAPKKIIVVPGRIVNIVL